MFSGFNEPQLSTLKKNLFGLASQLNGASSENQIIAISINNAIIVLVVILIELH